jgi:hypothetical protein
MGIINIEVGMTADLRYIGIQPPLTEEQHALLVAAEYIDSDIRSDFQTVQDPTQGAPYSRLQRNTSEYNTPQQASKSTVKTAERIAGVFRRAGEMVSMDTHMRFFESGENLFDSSAVTKFVPENGEFTNTEIELSHDGLERITDAATAALAEGLHIHPFNGQDITPLGTYTLLTRAAIMCEVLNELVPIPHGGWFKLIEDRATASSDEIVSAEG